MISKLNFGQALRFIVGCAMMALFFGFTTLAFAQEQDTERRFWPPNYRPAAAASPSTPAPSRPVKYKRTSPQLPKDAIPTAVERENIVGITIWRLRASEEADKQIAQAKSTEDTARILVVRKGKKSNFTPERVEASTAFMSGQMLRLSIEVPRTGYLYVLDREQYEDGSMSEPYLIYPADHTKGDNKVEFGRVVEIPSGTDEPFFEVQPLKSDNPKTQVAEVLTVLVTTTPLTGLPKPVRDDQGNYEPLQLPNADVEKWEKLWGTQVEQLELEEGAGKFYTRSEQTAGTTKNKRLTDADPLPQTLFRVAAKRGQPLLVKLPLKISK
jgi:hypothetical protein